MTRTAYDVVDVAATMAAMKSRIDALGTEDAVAEDLGIERDLVSRVRRGHLRAMTPHVEWKLGVTDQKPSARKSCSWHVPMHVVLREAINNAIATYGSLEEFCAVKCLSPGHVRMVARGQHEPGPFDLSALGLVRVVDVQYRKVSE